MQSTRTKRKHLHFNDWLTASQMSRGHHHMCPCKFISHRCKYLTFCLTAGAFVTTRKPREATKTNGSGPTGSIVPLLLTASCMDTTRTRQPRKPRFSTVFLFNENPADRPESGFDPSELVARLILINGPSKLTSLPFVTIRAATRGATVRERLTNPRETRPDRPGPPLPKRKTNWARGPI